VQQVGGQPQKAIGADAKDIRPDTGIYE